MSSQEFPSVKGNWIIPGYWSDLSMLNKFQLQFPAPAPPQIGTLAWKSKKKIIYLSEAYLARRMIRKVTEIRNGYFF